MTAGSDPSLITDRGRMIYGTTAPGAAVPCARTAPLTPDEVEAVVDAIAAGRCEKRPISLPTHLQTRDWPSVLDVMLLLDERIGRPPAGWKVGAASEEVRRSEGLPGPVPGRIYLDTVFRSGASLPPTLFINYRNVECELAFRLAESIEPRAEPYTEAEVSDRVDCLMPALELGDMVFPDWYGASGYFGSCLDNGGGAALVYGREIADWQELNLPDAQLSLFLNGTFVKAGFGRAAMGHPLTSLTWLANWLSERGRGLASGEIVSTGTCTGHCFAAPGDTVSLDVAGIGLVEARFEE